MENDTDQTTTSSTTSKRRYRKETVEEETKREVAALIETMESNPELVARTRHLRSRVNDHKRTYKLYEICSGLALLLLATLCTLFLNNNNNDDDDLIVERQNYRIARALLCTTSSSMWLALLLLAAFLSLCFVLAEDVLNTVVYDDISSNRVSTRRTRAQTLAKLCLTEALKLGVAWGEFAVVAYATERKVFNSLHFVLAVAPRTAFCIYFAAFLHALFDAQYLVFKAFASLDKLAFQAIAISSVVYSTVYAVASPFLGWHSSSDSALALVMLAILTANVLYPASYYYQFYVKGGFSYPEVMDLLKDDDDDDDEKDGEEEDEGGIIDNIDNNEDLINDINDTNKEISDIITSSSDI